MKSLIVHHTTVYRYARPVAFGPHRLMLRPRDSHDLRLVSTLLTVSPSPRLRWLHDVFGNSVAVATFDEPATELRIESTLQIDRYGVALPAFELEDDARTYPFVYSSEDRKDLGRTLERHSADPTGAVDLWAREFVTAKPIDTLELLASINNGIKAGFAYQARDEEGTQNPIDTLQRLSGTCRDYAFLMMEAVRSLGFGARFVTGYLYDPKLDGADGADSTQGAGATHAWVDVYLPGVGWVEYDPTNALIGSESLIRVAVTRDPAQASPVSGSFSGEADDYVGMNVDVRVLARGAERASCTEQAAA